MSAAIVVFGMMAQTTTASEPHQAYAWGNNNQGQSNVPDGEQFVQIATSGDHTIGLRADGTAVAFGWNMYGQCNIPSGAPIIQVAAGFGCSGVLREDGSVEVWGDPWYGMTNVPSGEVFTKIALGGNFALGLKSDGTVLAWGDNSEGQLNVPSGYTFTDISAGAHHAAALYSNGGSAHAVKCWGWDTFGQCSNAPEGNVFVKVSAGQCHTVALREDGTAVGWGQDYQGQINIPVDMEFVSITAGYDFTIGSREGAAPVFFGEAWYDVNAIPPLTQFTALDAQGYACVGLGFVDSDYDFITDSEDNCPQFLGADLDGDGVCGASDVFPNDPNEWSDFDGDGVGDNAQAASLGACCVTSGCVASSSNQCDSLGGSWLGTGGSCDNCPATCAGDIDANGEVDIEDLLQLIGSWGACP